MKPLFTAEELAELAAFDAEIDKDDRLTIDEIRAADQRDKFAKMQAGELQPADPMRDHHGTDRERERARSREYYRKNKEKSKANTREWRKRNRERVNALARYHYRKRKKNGGTQ